MNVRIVVFCSFLFVSAGIVHADGLKILTITNHMVELDLTSYSPKLDLVPDENKLPMLLPFDQPVVIPSRLGTTECRVNDSRSRKGIARSVSCGQKFDVTLTDNLKQLEGVRGARLSGFGALPYWGFDLDPKVSGGKFTSIKVSFSNIVNIAGGADEIRELNLFVQRELMKQQLLILDLINVQKVNGTFRFETAVEH